MVHVEKVILFDTGGVPVVLYDFNQNKLVLDEMLLSGFLSAISGFSLELLKNQSSHFIIDTGTQKISIFRGKTVLISVISTENLLFLKPDFDKVLDFFDQKYHIYTGCIEDPKIFEDFRVKLVRILFYLPIASDWIPTIKDPRKFEGYISKYAFLKEIDNNKSIEQLSPYSEAQKETFYEILNYLSYEKAIVFSHTIEPRDYIYATEKFRNLLSFNNDEYKIVKAKYAGINLIQLIKDITIVIRVHELEHNYGKKLIPIFEDLFIEGYIHILDETYRQLLISMDVTNDLLNILRTLALKYKFLPALLSFITQYDRPEILAYINIRPNSDQIEMNKSNLMINSRPSEEIIQLRTAWIEFMLKLMDYFYQKYAKQLNELLYNRILEHYLNLLHPADMTILEPIISKIESYQK